MVPPSRRRILLVAAALVVLAVAAYGLRWWIGSGAIQIIDPVVREWAAGEVARLSHDRYKLSATPLRIMPVEQRIVIDRIELATDTSTTDPAALRLPIVSLQLFHCAIDGIDLARLARRDGFSASRAGCDSVRSRIIVPAGIASDTSTNRGFLTLRERLDLARGVPFIDIDSIGFPNVKLALRIIPSSGRGTAMGFDRLAIWLNRFHYERGQGGDRGRTLLSDNVVVALDSFRSDGEGTDQIRLDRLRLDLARGTLTLNGLDWHPSQGNMVDVLGVAGLSVDSLEMNGINWRAFLTRGDARATGVRLAGGSVTIRDGPPGSEVSRESTREPGNEPRWTMGRTIDAIGRRISLDSLVANRLTVREITGQGETVTSVDSLRLDSLSAIPRGRGGYQGETTLGSPVITLAGIARHTPARDLAISRIGINFATGSANVGSVRLGPPGSDADWVRRHRTRQDRIELAFDSAKVTDLASGEWVRQGSYIANSLSIHGLALDVLSDKRLPAGRPDRHRYPQEWLAEVAPPIMIDTLDVYGRISYRERGKDSPRAGVLRFERLSATITGLRNILPAKGSSSEPDSVRFVARTSLMGVAPLELNVTMPPLSNSFRMHWRGSLGAMRATALNGFLDGAIGVRFTNGMVKSIKYDATVTNGRSRGTVVSRYDSLWIALPGTARSGFLSGIRRAVAKFAANQFVVREANGVDPGERTLAGTIDHRWRPDETLIVFLWHSLRDGLMEVIKR